MSTGGIHAIVPFTSATVPVIAKDVERRLEQHNAGTASRYTRSRLPVTLEYQEEQPNQSLALKRELAIKAMSRKAKEALIQSVK
jgi:predicted GIY-YIG superfamily endonuclease